MSTSILSSTTTTFRSSMSDRTSSASSSSASSSSMNYAYAIIFLRKVRDLRQIDLARKSDVPPSTLSLIESGETTDPTPAVLKRLARGLEVKVSDIQKLAARLPASPPLTVGTILLWDKGQVFSVPEEHILGTVTENGLSFKSSSYPKWFAKELRVFCELYGLTLPA